MCSVCCGTKVGLILEHQNERVAFVADTVAVRLLLLLLLLMYVGCCCCCCCWLLLLLMLCWQRHMVHVYICSSNTTVQLYMYRECLGIPSQCFFMPKKCPKMTCLPMPVSTVGRPRCARAPPGWLEAGPAWLAACGGAIRLRARQLEAVRGQQEPCAAAQ